jgi:glycine cleavage system H protein
VEIAMEPLMTAAETAGIVIVGLVLRLLLVLLGLAIIVIPILALFMALRLSGTLRERVQGFMRVGNLLWRRGLLYARGHTWIKEERGAMRIGMDDLVQRLFPAPAAVRLAPLGAWVGRGEPIAEITVEGRRARIGAPADGLVVAINDEVERDPTLLHRDPYRRGWLAMIKPDRPEVPEVRTGAAAREWLRNEDARLTAFFETQLGVAAADGGEYILPPHTLLTRDQWRAVEREFLGVDA